MNEWMTVFIYCQATSSLNLYIHTKFIKGNDFRTDFILETKLRFYEKNYQLLFSFTQLFSFRFVRIFLPGSNSKNRKRHTHWNFERIRGFLFVIFCEYVSGIRNVVHNLSLVRIIKITFLINFKQRLYILFCYFENLKHFLCFRISCVLKQ